MNYEGIQTDAEKQLWKEACVLFNDLLNELNSKHLLRKGISHEDREKLMLIWKNSYYSGLALNEMQNKFKSEKILLECASNSGLTADALAYALIAQLIGTGLMNLESVFKTSLLFFLEEEKGITRRMTLGALLFHIRDKISKPIGERLIKMIDNDIRISLAHGIFWFKEDGQKIFLAKNSYLDEVREMQFYEFWIELKKINIISVAFTNVLHEKILAGYFQP